MTDRTLLEVPPGVACFFGREARLRRDIERRVATVFTGWSYEEIVLPLFDFDDVFTRGRGHDRAARRGIYRFVGRDGEVLALRPDFTALVAKVVVSRLGARELPLRLFYSGDVLRYQPPRAGQQEELFQIGLEHFGGGEQADVEVLLVAIEAMSSVGLDDALVTLGHIGIALSLLRSVSASESEKRDALEAMRHHDRDALKDILGAPRAESLSELIGLSGGSEVIAEAKLLLGEESSEALGRLGRLAAGLEALGLGSSFRLDLGEVRGFDYYTGLVFEIHASGAPRELGGGGRYDSLLGRFGRELPAVGFYLSLDRLAELLEKKGVRAESADTQKVTNGQQALDLRREGGVVRWDDP